MNYNFICPKCKGQLRIGEQIIFSTKTDKGASGLILLNPEVGDYKVLHHPTYKFEQGESIDFYCPICHTNLTSKLHGNLAEVKMIDEDAKEYKILFGSMVQKVNILLQKELKL